MISQHDLPQAKFLPDASSSPLEFLKRYLKNGESSSSSASPYQTKYESSQQGTLIQISQRLSTGLVRVIWESTLKANDDNSNLYDFTEQLFHMHQASKTSYDKLQKAFDRLEEARDDWKDTAEKLEHVWENEKSELLENFLTLYRKQQEMTAQAQERLQQLEEELEKTKQELVNAVSNSQTYKKDKMLANMLNEEPDDMDTDLYPKELVEKLAGTGKSKHEPRRGQKRPSTTTVVPKKIRNKATGAIEYFDDDEALADIVELSKNGTNVKNNGDNESARKNSQKPARGRKSKKDDSSTDSAGNYSYSEMDSDVLAQLAAMKGMDE